MEINRHNYEAYLLDLIEGSLSVEEQRELQNFLLLNPDCNAELGEQEPWMLEMEQVSYSNSEHLKKEFPGPTSILTDHNFDLFSIARMEGDLTAEQSAAHQSMLIDDEQLSERWSEWQKTRLESEPLIYQGKDRLIHRKGLKRRVIWMTVVSTAAAITLLIVLFRTGPPVPQQELSVQTPQEGMSELAIQVPAQADERSNQAVVDLSTQTKVDLPTQTIVDPSLKITSNSPVHRAKDPVVSNNSEPDRSLEHDSELDVTSQDDLQAKVSGISLKQLNSLSAAIEAVPDQIEPLHVRPVPNHMSSLSIAQISEMDLQEVVKDYTEEKDISLLKIANAGIKGINKITKSDISLMASRDEKGDVSGFQLKSKRFSFVRPLGRED